jgi:hypothetical protein
MSDLHAHPSGSGINTRIRALCLALQFRLRDPNALSICMVHVDSPVELGLIVCQSFPHVRLLAVQLAANGEWRFMALPLATVLPYKVCTRGSSPCLVLESSIYCPDGISILQWQKWEDTLSSLCNTMPILKGTSNEYLQHLKQAALT